LSKVTNYLKHVGNQLVNGFFSVTPVSALLEGMSLVAESTLGGRELEGPQEVVSLLEMGSDSVDFVDQVFGADDAVLTEGLFNNFVGGDGDSLLVDLTETSLVNQIRDGVSSGVAESDIRFDLLDHVKSSSVNSDEDTVVDLSKSEQLEDLSDLGSQVVNTSDSDHKDDSRFSGNVERTSSSGFSSELDSILFFSSELLVMSFTSLSIFGSLSLGLFLSLGQPSLSGISQLGVSGSLLENSFGDVLLGLFDLH